MRPGQFCVASPLACMSGVTGAGLKKRMALHHDKKTFAQIGLQQEALT